MPLTLRLLGPPEIELGGSRAPPPRGHKAWAVLAYLVLSDRPVARARLAEVVFPAADDPLGALRWTLAQLRRALGLPDGLRGDPLVLELPPGARVDVLELTAAQVDPALARGELLEGVEPDATPAFDAWLLVERRRLAGVCDGLLRDAALERLAAGAPLEAAALTTRALAISPFDEGAHELLVRCLARAGQPGAARHHATACELLFRRELGRAPDPRVRRAAQATPDDPTEGSGRHDDGDRQAALGQLAAGRAAIAAGAIEPGVACLRQACGEARAVGEDDLLARALFALGVALVHAIRGRDEEGAAVLHEALALAERCGDDPLAGRACRELGFVAVQAARGASAGRWLHRATQLARTGSEQAAVLGVRGMALSDRGHYAAAIAMLEGSISHARASGDARQEAWSLAILGRALLLRLQLDRAAEVLDASLALVGAEGWIALQPLPEALRAEVALRQGDATTASALLEHAFSLGCRLGDPCWEALAARATGLVHASRDETPAALARLRDAASRAVRVADPYVWVQAHCLDALAGVAVAAGEADAAGHVAALERVAARGDLRELVVRAAVHRARLGDRSGLPAARGLAAGVDNPALHATLAAA